jgi:bacterioferritin
LDLQQVISRLNWFYSLEMNQVELYTMQSKQVDDIYIKHVLERVAEIEQGHVENIGEKIRELGGKPTHVGELLAPLTGKIAGFLTSWPGTLTVLKADINLEEKAMKDYRDFIIKVGDKDLFKLLWGNLVDEDLHTAWFANKVKELEAWKN